MCTSTQGRTDQILSDHRSCDRYVGGSDRVNKSHSKAVVADANHFYGTCRMR
jgi:hypothetical protein